MSYIFWLKMCMMWPSGRMRSLPVSPRNGSARAKRFSSFRSSPLKSTRGEGGDKKTCRSCNVMHPRLTINPCRAKEADAGSPIPARKARHGTARHGTPRTHPLLRRRRTDPHVRRPFVTGVTGDTGRRPPAAGRSRRQHLGQRLRGAPPRRGRPRWGRVARSQWRCTGSREGCGERPATRRAGGCRAVPGRGPRLPEHPLAPSPPTPYPRCGIRCSPSLRRGSGERRQPQQRVGVEGRERRRSERSRSPQRETPGWPSGDRRGVMVR